jgi:DNA modification methylase
MDAWWILTGDCRELLATLPAASVDCCVTSPPYWGLRDYGHAGQLGLEATPAEYVASMVEVFRAVRRVLRDDGTLWLNLGDSYAAGKCGRDDEGPADLARRAAEYGTGVPKAEAKGANGVARKAPPGLKPKDLVGIPWMVAFALRADGWYLRSDVIWSKPNPMLESVTDRPTKAHEYVFLLAKGERYFYDADAIRDRAVTGGRLDTFSGASKDARAMGAARSGNERPGVKVVTADHRNARSVWTITSEPYDEAHFATFPQALARRCILAGSAKGGTVLDPFNGAGTTGVVAVKHERRYVGIELNPEYVAMSSARLERECPRLLWAMREGAAQ